MANIISQVMRVFGDGYKDSMEDNGTCGVLGALWGYSRRIMGCFSDGGDIDMADGGGGDRLCVWAEIRK